MKLVQDTTQGLGDAATKLATSIETAVNTVSGLSTSLPTFITERVSAVQASLQTVGSELLQLPQAVDPSPVVASLTAGASKTRELMTGFSQALDQLPSSVHAFAGQAQPLIDQATTLLLDHASVVESARAKVAQLEALSPREADVPAAVRAWWERAAQAMPVVQAYAEQASAAAPEQDLDALRHQTRETLTRIQTDVLQACTDYRAALEQGGPALGESFTTTDTAQSPGAVRRQASMQTLASAGAGLDGAAEEGLQAALARVRALVPDISSEAIQPLTKARAELDAMSSKLSQAGAAAWASVEAALAPLHDIPPKLSQAVVSLAEVLSAFKATLAELRKLIEGLIARAQQVITQLDGLPALFDTVRSSIDAALAQIADVAARIPLFISQSLGALTMASGELTQAASLCDYAIEICTRYMTKAPLLIPARALFMGIKATIPTVQLAITAAKGTVQQVGTTAQTGLDQASLAVKGLFPTLDTAVAQVKSSSMTLAGMIKTLQGSLDQGMVRMEGTGSTIETQIRQIGQQTDASAAAFSKLPGQYAQRVPLEASLKAFEAQLKQVSATAMDPVETAVGQTRPRMEALLNQAEQALLPKLEASSSGLQSALARTEAHAVRFEAGASDLDSQLEGSGQDLRELHRAALEAVDREQGRLVELFATVLARLDEVHGEVVAVRGVAGANPSSDHG